VLKLIRVSGFMRDVQPSRCVLIVLVVILSAFSVAGQSNTGEVRLKVTDPTGLGLQSTVEIGSDANQLQQRFLTDGAGNLVVRQLPFGVYRIRVEHQGFSPYAGSIDIRSVLPTEEHVTLSVAAVSTFVTVKNTERPMILTQWKRLHH